MKEKIQKLLEEKIAELDAVRGLWMKEEDENIREDLVKARGEIKAQISILRLLLL